MVDGEMNLPGMQLAAKNLNCQAEPNTLDFLNTDPNLDQFGTCTFPGVEVFRVVHSIISMRDMITPFLDEIKGKFPAYQIKQGFMQGSRIEENLMKISNYEAMLRQYIDQAKSAFKIVFDESTLNEWMAANVAPGLNQLLEWKELFVNASTKVTWPARPLSVPALNEVTSATQGIAGTTVKSLFAEQLSQDPFKPINAAELARGQLFFR